MTNVSARQFKTSLWRILWALAGETVPIPVLQARTGIAHDQIYTTLRRLERTAIVRRAADDADGRTVVRWSLTEAGKTVIRDFAAHASAAAERMAVHDDE